MLFLYEEERAPDRIAITAFLPLALFLNSLTILSIAFLSADKQVKVELLYLSLTVEAQQAVLFHYRKHMIQKGLRVRHTGSQN